MSQSSVFLTIPTELRQQILEYALPVRYLTAQSITDQEWVHHVDEGARRGVAECLFVCRQFYKEATPIFYSKVILEVAPIRPSSYSFDTLTSLGYRTDLAATLDYIFGFCPAKFLQRIRTVHVFTGQRDTINAESYEAMLRWLVNHTGVTSINLSYLLMTRLRKTRIDIRSLNWFMTGNINTVPTRTIHIFTNSKRSPWEKMRRAELEKALKHRDLPQLQVYMLRDGSTCDPVLDPRWDVRRSDGPEHFSMLDSLTDRIDRLTSLDPLSSQARIDDWIKAGEGLTRLYQVLFVIAL